MTRKTYLLAAILGSSAVVAVGGCTELDLGEDSDSLVLKDPTYDPNALTAAPLSMEPGARPTPPVLVDDYSGIVEWAESFGGAYADSSESMALGRFGEVVLTGSVADSVDFGSGQNEATGYDQAFVAVYNTSGRHIWSDCSIGTGDHHGRAVATDFDGNVYIAGDFAGHMILGGHAHDARGRTDAFVAKYSVNGGLLWSRVFGGEGDETATAIAIDSSGHVVVAGTFYDALEVGDFDLSGHGGSDVFLASLTNDGMVLGARSIGGATDDEVGDIAVSSKGRIAVTTTYINTETGKRNAAIISLHRSASLAWMRQLTGLGDNEVNAVAFDANENLFAVGSYTESMVLRDAEFPPALNRDGFALVISPEGDTRWNRRMGSTGNDVAETIAIDPQHGLFIAGTLSEPSHGATDIFVLSVTFHGQGEWARVFGGVGRDTIAAAVTDDKGQLILTGGFEKVLPFDDEKIESRGDRDFFLLSIVQ